MVSAKKLKWQLTSCVTKGYGD